MGLYQKIRELWKNPSEQLGAIYRERLAEWRKQPVTIRIQYPTRIDRARSLGFKAKQGFLIVRQRVSKGGRMRLKRRKARRSKAQRRMKILSMNYQQVAEQRANKTFKNCEVLNSYWVGEDGVSKWYEVILIDRNHPNILADNNLKHLVENKGRVFRGLTSAGRKARGLRNKGTGAEKLRPSITANYKQRKDLTRK
ncbi:50S ribosomal protein L15e [Candidatus Woesearchaeota archaeon]|nr:MAG: 50S ribosomal protein L15e [Candidatus Woesearchaeota archaeon]